MADDFISLTFELPLPPDPAPDGTLMRIPPPARRLDALCEAAFDVDTLIGLLVSKGHIPAETDRLSYALVDASNLSKLPKGRSLAQLGIPQGTTLRVRRVHWIEPRFPQAQSCVVARSQAAQ